MIYFDSDFDKVTFEEIKDFIIDAKNNLDLWRNIPRIENSRTLIEDLSASLTIDQLRKSNSSYGLPIYNLNIYQNSIIKQWIKYIYIDIRYESVNFSRFNVLETSPIRQKTGYNIPFILSEKRLINFI